ncbi:MAG: hypothetical protein WD048_02140 [Chitinophagales bacterium]
MITLRIRVHEKVYKHLMWLFSKFKKDEIEVFEESGDFVSVQAYMERELKKVENGTTEIIDLDQLDQNLEAVIKKHED